VTHQMRDAFYIATHQAAATTAPFRSRRFQTIQRLQPTSSCCMTVGFTSKGPAPSCWRQRTTISKN
jgi:hypothetical protein